MILSDASNLYVFCKEQKNEVLHFAAQEFFRYLRKITGAEKSRPSTELVLEFESDDIFSPDSFKIEASPEVLYISGANARSVLYGVYAVLEKLGCVFCLPGEEEEYVPSLAQARLEEGEFSEKALLVKRGLALHELCDRTGDFAVKMLDFMAKNRYNLLLTSDGRYDPADTQVMLYCQVREKLLPELRRRGIIIELSEHMTHMFMPAEKLIENPHWAAMVNGERLPEGQLCYACNEAVEYLCNGFCEYVKTRPEAHVFALWPLDGNGYCECGKCAGDNTVFAASCVIAEELKKIRPDAQFEFLAYKPETKRIPAVKCADNMNVLLCDEFGECVGDWVGLSSGAGGCVMLEYDLGNSYRYQGNTWIAPGHSRPLAEKLARLGYDGVISYLIPLTSFWRPCLNYYFFGKYLWSSPLSEEELLRKIIYAKFPEHQREVLEVVSNIIEKTNNLYLFKKYHLRARSFGCENFNSEDDFDKIISSFRELLESLDVLFERITRGKKELLRWKAYVYFFISYYVTRTENFQPLPLSRHSEELAESAFADYFEEFEEAQMLCSSMKFLKWRFDKIAKWDTKTLADPC